MPEKPEKEFKDYCTFDQRRKIIGYLIVVGGLGISYFVGFTFSNHLMGLAIVGLGTFLSMLSGAFLITDTWTLEDGEFRKAITVSVLSVYFFSLAFGDQIIIENLRNTAGNATAAVVQTNLVGGLFNNFWVVVTAVIAFYFAVKAVEKK